jgi:hypothetical protein
MLKKGKFRAEKILYPDGVGCCIWEVPDGWEESSGLAWDFSFDDIDQIIELLTELKAITPEIFKENTDAQDQH